MPKSKIYVGMSGWTYPAWRGGFYPKGLVQKKELEYASRQVTSIEINGTFYSLQKPESFQRWYSETPDDFRFSIKGPKYITHVRRLKDVAEPLANFFASGLLCLAEKLGPLLWQFPPSVILKDDRFEKFMKLLPHDMKSASKLALKHTDKVAGRSFTTVKGNAPVRHAFEFRHHSFRNADFIAMMRAKGVAVVFAHSGDEKSPYMEDITADFVYARLHGQEYKKGYPPKFLKSFSERLKIWTAGGQPDDADCIAPAAKGKTSVREAYVYFDTEAKAYAPQDAKNLLSLLAYAK